MENKIEVFAEAIGVNLHDEFVIVDASDNPYMVTEEGLRGSSGIIANNLIGWILIGELHIQHIQNETPTIVKLWDTLNDEEKNIVIETFQIHEKENFDDDYSYEEAENYLSSEDFTFTFEYNDKKITWVSWY